MARPLRSDLPDGVFHVTARGTGGIAIYRDDDDRRLFLALLLSCVERLDWQLHAVCLMTTLYHLVLAARQEDLSLGEQRLNGVYAQSFNQRHTRFGHLFADRFGARAIDADRYLRAACDYVILNPVRAGICKQPADYAPWVHSRYGLVPQSRTG
jgi:REP-associated tyrosine transposase